VCEGRPVRYRLYIDESGDHAYSLLDRPAHRYLALLGVWFRQEQDYLPFADAMADFKKSIFGPRPDRPVVLHRSDVINRRGAFGILKDVEIERRFNEGLLSLARSATFKLIIVVIDKQAHLKRYTGPYHPYHYCLAAMLDRYSGYLKFKDGVGDVMAEPRGGKEDRELCAAYRRVYDGGTHMFSHELHQRALTSNKIKIQPKSRNIPGLQLADVFAHPVKQAALRKRGIATKPATPFASELLQIAREKANRQEFRGSIDGYGCVWL